jgi:hypothetical protein
VFTQAAVNGPAQTAIAAEPFGFVVRNEINETDQPGGVEVGSWAVTAE